MTKLNDANKIYMGAAAASAVYAGVNKVWPPSGPPFDPSSIPGLEVWLDASRAILNDGDPVSGWGNAGTGSNPVFSSPYPVFRKPMLNGMGVVRFSAGQGTLRGTTSATQNYTLLYVTRAWGSNTGRAFASIYPNTNYLVGFHSTGQDWLVDAGQGAGPHSAWGSFPGPWKLYGADGVVTGGTYTSRLFISGVMSGTISVPATTSGTGLYGYYNISGYDPGGGTTETADCDLAELLIYTRQLADSDRVKVENYLRSKWGLT